MVGCALWDVRNSRRRKLPNHDSILLQMLEKRLEDHDKAKRDVIPNVTAWKCIQMLVDVVQMDALIFFHALR